MKVLITGGSRGIGLSLADILRLNMKVVTAQRSSSPYPFVYLDLSRPGSVDAACEEIVKQHGEIDVLVNNAAYFPSSENLFQESAMLIDKSFSVNCLSPLRLMRFFLPRMEVRGTGLVVNVSSASITNSLPSMFAYRSSKAALVASTAYIQTSIPIRFVDPGWCKSDMGGPCAPHPTMEGAHRIASIIYKEIHTPSAYL